MDILADFENALVMDAKGASLDSEPPEEWLRINRKRYPRLPSIDLPDDGAPPPSLLANRRSHRHFVGEIDIGSLARTLNWGVRARRDRPESRPYPTAGARTAVEWYVVACKVSGLASGTYHYNPHEHLLDVLDELDPTPTAERILDGQPFWGTPSALLIATASFPRMWTKYGPRGHRYAYLEAGAAGMAVNLAAQATGLLCCWIGGFPDRVLSDLLGVSFDLEREAPILMLAITPEE